jgi:hypothetical protein
VGPASGDALPFHSERVQSVEPESSTLRFALLVTQRDHGIDLGRAARWYVTGKHGHGC